MIEETGSGIGVGFREGQWEVGHRTLKRDEEDIAALAVESAMEWSEGGANRMGRVRVFEGRRRWRGDASPWLTSGDAAAGKSHRVSAASGAGSTFIWKETGPGRGEADKVNRSYESDPTGRTGHKAHNVVSFLSFLCFFFISHI